VKLVYMAGVRTEVHVFAICVKTGIVFKMRNTLFFHVSVLNIYGTSSSIYLIVFLQVTSKVLFFNITQKFTNFLVQLSILLIDLLDGTYRLSSPARLEAFVIQTNLKLLLSFLNEMLLHHYALLLVSGSSCSAGAVLVCRSPFFEDFSATQTFLLQQVNNQLVHDFLFQQNTRLFLFLSELMDLFVAG